MKHVSISGLFPSTLRRCGIGVVVVALAGSGLVAAESAEALTTQVVHSFTVGGWFGVNEGPTNSVGSSALVGGPATAPAGTGSAQLVVDSTGRASLGTNQFSGTRLDAINGLSYWGYSATAAGAGYPVMQFDVDYDLTDLNTSYQGRLSYLAPAAPVATWTQFDAFAGNWWATGAPGNAVCTQGSPCTLPVLLGLYPNAGIRNDATAKGALLLRLGGPVAGGATVFVDAVVVSTTSGTTVADFEPGVVVAPNIGPAGTSVSISAYGFRAGRPVKFRYDTFAPRGKKHVTLCKIIADVNGAAVCNATLPSGAAAGPAGVHTISIKGRSTTGLLLYSPDFILTP